MKNTLTITSCLVILTTIAGAAVLWILKPILIPFVIAVMLSYLFYPLIEKLAKVKVPRIVTILLIFLLAFLLLGNFVSSLVSSLIEFSSRFPAYSQEFAQLVDRYSADYPIVNEALGNVSSFLLNLPYGSVLNTALSSTVSYLSNIFLILLFFSFLCLSAHTFSAKVQRAFPGAQGKHILKIGLHINTDIKRYLIIHTLISLATGFSVGLICWFFGVPFFLLWGFLTFILNYIPNIGSVLSALPPIITAAVVLGVQPALWLAITILLVQMIWGNVVEPKVAGDSLGISPLVILLSLVFWAWLWGVVGAILAVPIAVMIKVTCANIPKLKSISVLMGDK